MNLIELTKKLVEFPSYNGNIDTINSCLDFCIGYFANNPNIFIRRVEKNGVRSVLFSNADVLNFDVLEVGHIDVVPVNDFKMFNPKISGDIMYGRGAGDMKGSVAAAMKLFDHVIENNLKLRYGLLIVTDEEPGGFDGSKYWADELGLKAKIILDGDAGGELNTIIYKSKACFFVKLTSIGESAHGSKPWLGVDANEGLINTINNLRKEFPYISRKNPPNDEWITTMHVGTIAGGEMINSIASCAEAVVDFRYTEKYSNESLLEIVKNCLDDGVEVLVQEEGIPVFNDINNRYIQLYKSIVEAKTGKNVKFDFTTGASDSRYFAKDGAVIISNQPDCGNLHSDNEWLNIVKLEEFFNIRVNFINQL